MQTSATGLKSPVLPGATIGMVGGGQLGRMFALAAMSMGYRVAVLTKSKREPAAQVVESVFVGSLDDASVVSEFASQCDVITLEFENIPAETIRRCGESCPTFPSHRVLATAQDRLIEKQTFRDAGLPVTPFAAVASTEDVIRFAETAGWPVIVKTARSGYDGKGQHRLEDASQAREVPWDSSAAWIAEQFIPFDREVSVVVARSAVGEVRCFPPFENDHSNHILDVSFCPSTLSAEVAEQALAIATRAAETIDLTGVLCVELFVINEQELMINEVAPRPHNSGHLTIEACPTSQFEQHVRAVCGLPLGDCDLRVGGAAMANLLGDLWDRQGNAPDWTGVLRTPTVSLHLYGKSDAKPGRKMGHLTATAADAERARGRVLAARGALEAPIPGVVTDSGR
ncbi:5-(carboxyamino)imidazole ribonucleotide synthase [Roseiconus nitratireducens]|nr:5-(carboxyamino)imidazole ribonucleotide synthase [Roseiconus nitratireducens]